MLLYVCISTRILSISIYKSINLHIPISFILLFYLFRVFFKVSIDGREEGDIVMELFDEVSQLLIITDSKDPPLRGGGS